MSAIDPKAIEAAANAIDDTYDVDPRGDMTNIHQVATAAITAYLQARSEAGFVEARVERVSGDNMGEWRENISPELHRTGDCVLAWANEGDLVTAEFNRMISAHGGAE
jgi:RecJ-like exonuclease